MKRLIILIVFTLTVLTTPSLSFAQSMIGGQFQPSSDGHTAREEAEGKEIWEKLQSKQLECKTLTDDNYDSLGEYFMGQMTGKSHEAMNNMMEKMMGKEGEEQMHIVMGKRLSGCDTSASGVGIMPMMTMMMGMMGSAGSPQVGGGGNSMMGYGGWNNMMGGFGVLGWLSMLLFWGLLILGVIALIRYLTKSGDNKEGKTPLDILKERYAKGEINKKEFEEMKKELA